MAFDRTTPGDEDIEAIVHLAFLDDLLPLDVILPIARAQDFPDLGMRELVEELEASQHSELLLAIDTGIGLAQPLVDASELGREIETALVPLRRILLQRHRHDVLELLGDVLAERVYRW